MTAEGVRGEGGPSKRVDCGFFYASHIKLASARNEMKAGWLSVALIVRDLKANICVLCALQRNALMGGWLWGWVDCIIWSAHRVRSTFIYLSSWCISDGMCREPGRRFSLFPGIPVSTAPSTEWTKWMKMYYCILCIRRRLKIYFCTSQAPLYPIPISPILGGRQITRRDG